MSKISSCPYSTTLVPKFLSKTESLNNLNEKHQLNSEQQQRTDSSNYLTRTKHLNSMALDHLRQQSTQFDMHNTKNRKKITNAIQSIQHNDPLPYFSNSELKLLRLQRTLNPFYERSHYNNNNSNKKNNFLNSKSPSFELNNTQRNQSMISISKENLNKLTAVKASQDINSIILKNQDIQGFHIAEINKLQQSQQQKILSDLEAKQKNSDLIEQQITSYRNSLKKDDVDTLCNHDTLEPYDSVLNLITSNERNQFEKFLQQNKIEDNNLLSAIISKSHFIKSNLVNILDKSKVSAKEQINNNSSISLDNNNNNNNIMSGNKQYLGQILNSENNRFHTLQSNSNNVKANDTQGRKRKYIFDQIRNNYLEGIAKQSQLQKQEEFKTTQEFEKNYPIYKWNKHSSFPFAQFAS